MTSSIRRKLMLAIPLALAAVLLLTLSAMAHGDFGEERPLPRQSSPQQEQCDCQRGSERATGRLHTQKKLDLSPAQQEQLAELALDFRTEMIEVRSEEAIKKLELQRLWLAETPNQQEIDEIIDQLAAIWSRTRKIQANYALQLQSILTDSQWEKMQASRYRHRGAQSPMFH